MDCLGFKFKGLPLQHFVDYFIVPWAVKYIGLP
jgi:hypothetical protein